MDMRMLMRTRTMMTRKRMLLLDNHMVVKSHMFILLSRWQWSRGTLVGEI